MLKRIERFFDWIEDQSSRQVILKLSGTGAVLSLLGSKFDNPVARISILVGAFLIMLTLVVIGFRVNFHRVRRGQH